MLEGREHHPVLPIRERAAVYPPVQEALQQIQHGYELLEGMGPEREKWQQHCLRVGLLAHEIGKTANLTPESLLIVTLGGALHDVGKVNVPTAILDAPRRLTSEEHTIIQNHTEDGALLVLEHVRPIRMAEKIVPMLRYHHATQGDRSYPDRIENLIMNEEDLKRIGIVTMADVVDSVASRRNYDTRVPTRDLVDELRFEFGNNALIDTAIREARRIHNL